MRLLLRLSPSKKSLSSWNNSWRSARLNSTKYPRSTKKSKQSARSFWTSWKIWRVKSESTAVSDPSRREKLQILKRLSSATPKLTRCHWLLDIETVPRTTTLTPYLIKNQHKIKFLRTASALSKVPLMAIMSVSLHMVRPDQERPSRSKVTKKIRAWLLAQLCRCLTSSVRWPTSEWSWSVTWLSSIWITCAICFCRQASPSKS